MFNGENMSRSILILNAKVLAMDGKGPYESIAVVKGKVAYLGSSDTAMRKFSSRVDRIIELNGNLVTPGFIDSHCHMASTGYLMRRGVDFSGVSSLGELKDALRRIANGTGLRWIYGYGLNEALLKEGRLPRRWDLDEAVNNVPVVIEHVSGHLIMVNTKALRLARIGRGVRDPPGGLIERDENGEPTGVLYDNAMELVLRILPAPSLEDYYLGVIEAQEVWLRNGFTGVEDAGVLGLGGKVLDAYLKAASAGQLKIRVRYSYPVESDEELRNVVNRIARPPLERLHLNHVKVFYDGSGLAKTALIYGKWCKDGIMPDDTARGLRLTDPSTFMRILRMVVRSGLGISVHAIGDRAVDEVIKAFKRVGCGEKCSIVHGFLMSDSSVAEAAKMGISIKTQSSFIYLLGGKYAANFCHWRMRRFIPLRTLMEAGVNVANGTDANVTPPDPRYGLYGAVARRAVNLNIDVYSSEEAVSFLDVIRTYTVNSARSVRNPWGRGPGRLRGLEP